MSIKSDHVVKIEFKIQLRKDAFNLVLGWVYRGHSTPEFATRLELNSAFKGGSAVLHACLRLECVIGRRGEPQGGHKTALVLWPPVVIINKLLRNKHQNNHYHNHQN